MRDRRQSITEVTALPGRPDATARSATLAGTASDLAGRLVGLEPGIVTSELFAKAHADFGAMLSVAVREAFASKEGRALVRVIPDGALRNLKNTVDDRRLLEQALDSLMPATIAELPSPALTEEVAATLSHPVLVAAGMGDEGAPADAVRKVLDIAIVKFKLATVHALGEIGVTPQAIHQGQDMRRSVRAAVESTTNGVGHGLGLGSADRQSSPARTTVDAVNEESAFVSGSRSIRIRDVLNYPGLLIPFPWRREGNRHDEPGDLIDFVLSGIGTGNRFFVLSGPGYGKSLLSHVLTGRLRKSYGDARPVLRLDLLRYRSWFGDPEFGTKSWIAREMGSAAGKDPLIVLDALDEFMAGRSASAVIEELRRPLFNRAHVITCRSAFYRQFVAMAPLSDGCETITLSSWKPTDARAYVDACIQLHGENPVPSVAKSRITRGRAVARAFFRRADVERLCSTPLRVTMALEIVGLSGGVAADAHVHEPSEMGTNLEFYGEFVDRVLRRESAKPGNVLTAEQKAEILEEVAWYFCDDTLGDVVHPTNLTSSELGVALSRLSLPSKLEAVQSDIEDLSVLDRIAVAGPGNDEFSFGHRTIQDYFIARRLFRMLDTNVAEVGTMFSRLSSPSVSELYKEYVAVLRRRDPARLVRLSERSRRAIEVLEADHGHDREAYGRLRLAVGQLLYYIGVIGVAAGVGYLRSRLPDEKDAWLQRNIMLGLAFTGDLSEESRYVESLRDERRRRSQCPLNEANLGFHFSFFGDQPLDPTAPEIDQGLHRCDLTVSSLIYQLGRPVTTATWMIDLYTLVDLWANVPWARATVEAYAAEHLRSLRRCLAVFKADPVSRGWPDVARLRELVDRVAKL